MANFYLTPRLWLLDVTDGAPQIPRTIDVTFSFVDATGMRGVPGATIQLTKTVTLWTERQVVPSFGASGLPAVIYRRALEGDARGRHERGWVLIATKIGAVIGTINGVARTGWLCVVWSSAATSTGTNPDVDDVEAFLKANNGPLVEAWGCNWNSADSTWRVAALNNDAGAAASAAKAAWPGTWRKSAAGDPANGPYTGARFVAEVV